MSETDRIEGARPEAAPASQDAAREAAPAAGEPARSGHGEEPADTAHAAEDAPQGGGARPTRSRRTRNAARASKKPAVAETVTEERRVAPERSDAAAPAAEPAAATEDGAARATAPRRRAHRTSKGSERVASEGAAQLQERVSEEPSAASDEKPGGSERHGDASVRVEAADSVERPAARRAQGDSAPAGLSVSEMSLQELMASLPRRRRGRPSKKDNEARKALEAAMANPTPELVQRARDAAEGIIGDAASKRRPKAETAPAPEAAAEPKAPELSAEPAPKAAAESSEPQADGADSAAQGAAGGDGGYGARRRHHERRNDGQGADERRSKPQQQQDGRSQQQGQQNQRQDRRDRNQQRRNDGRNDRDRNGQGNYGGQGQQFGKGRNGKNGNQRQRDYIVEPKTNRAELEELKVSDLRAKAAEFGIDAAGLKKPELVDAVYSALVKQEGFFEFTGILDLANEGFGYIRTKGYLASENDVYICASAVRQNALRRGDEVTGIAHVGRPSDKYPGVARVTLVNGREPEEMRGRPRFGDLTPVFPAEPLRMEHGRDSILGRCIDLLAPVGKGQRGLIVSPPKAGKTTVLKKIAESIAANNPEVHLICLLVDERPEEVTDMQRSIRGEVVASTFDMPSDNHITVSELVIERAKRLVELGEDVVILLDSITRLARAYNLAQPASGRILSGGVDSTALYPPKRFLGAARNIEGGGSLTILASALVETGSKMDEVIFEEFKGTGNMELRLDRDLADRRIFPAIDPISSGTRKEELLLDSGIAPFVWGVRRILSNMNSNERAMSTLIRSLKATANNEEFLIRSAKKAQNQELGVGEL